MKSCYFRSKLYASFWVEQNQALILVLLYLVFPSTIPSYSTWDNMLFTPNLVALAGRDGSIVPGLSIFQGSLEILRDLNRWPWKQLSPRPSLGMLSSFGP